MTKNKPSSPPRLIQCATFWSMIGYPPGKKEWSDDQKMTAIKEAGFDGVAIRFNAKLKALADSHGLVPMGGFDVKSAALAVPILKEQAELGVKLLNIQLMNHDTLPAKAGPEAVKVIREAKRLGLLAHIEVHRDTATETPEKFDEIARLYKKATGELLPVTWDHSHFAVSKHVQAKDFSARLLAWPKLIQASQLFHLRPFNAQHCQVSVLGHDGSLTPEFRDYLAFLEDLFVVWLSGPRPGNELWTCPELGMSHGYHVSTNPHPWPGVIRARTEYAAAWQRALKRVK